MQLVEPAGGQVVAHAPTEGWPSVEISQWLDEDAHSCIS